MLSRRTFAVGLLLVGLLGLSTVAFAEDSFQLDQNRISFRGEDGQLVEGRRCATYDDADPALLRTPHDMELWLQERDRLDKASPTINIPVWIHNIYYQSGGNNVGYVTDQMANDQIAVLNGAYNALGYNFVLYSVDRYNSQQYSSFNLGSNKERRVKQYLAVYPQYVLNIYCVQPPGGTLGWAYFPWSYPQDSYWHGVVLLSQSLPGGGAVPYDEGDTGTHEVGHWAGLYHVFQGGCSGNGDFVADTPPQATPSYGCPVGKNTCAGGGPDSIYNFMDYSDDSCMDEFTPGQNDRIDWAMSTYRPLMGTVGKDVTLASRGGLPIDALDTEPAVAEGLAARSATGLDLDVHPNPFNPRTEIRFAVDAPGYVTVQLYDAKGRRVQDVFRGMKARGAHSLALDGRDLASGVYHVVVRQGARSATERITLVK